MIETMIHFQHILNIFKCVLKINFISSFIILYVHIIIFKSLNMFYFYFYSNNINLFSK